MVTVSCSLVHRSTCTEHNHSAMPREITQFSVINFHFYVKATACRNDADDLPWARMRKKILTAAEHEVAGGATRAKHILQDKRFSSLSAR